MLLWRGYSIVAVVTSACVGVLWSSSGYSKTMLLLSPPPFFSLPSTPSSLLPLSSSPSNHSPNAQNVEIKDFRQSWSNGLAFCAIIHSFLPDKIPYDDLTPDNPRENFTIAFEAAKYVTSLTPTSPPTSLPNLEYHLSSWQRSLLVIFSLIGPRLSVWGSC